ncbi:hypothetical protein EDD36DRAFT_28618 [Exophiala viscosa]|uniref:DUF7065 domain-containing protein n=1 Tax=Exophiala viscosa TaxID=2486360 RepID=A0AAN6IHZ7_9EURO|nr:hypothetical protein EDD36DRAFT_28618 [Exophiala viscosa]
MRSTGQADLPEYGEEVHHRQPPGEAQNWQDSVVLVWWDEVNSVGGFHRLGHEPNAVGGGKVTCWNYLWAPEGVYKKTGYNALRDQDLLPNGGYGNGDDTCRSEYVDGENVWSIDDPEHETSACLKLVDISGNVDCFPKSASIKSFNTAHFDIPIRDNVVAFAKDLDVVAYVEIDGATNRGGHLKWTLVSGEVLDIECTALPIPGVVSYHNDNCVVERFCSWTSGGLKGFCDFETTSNIQKGSRTPKNSALPLSATDSGQIDRTAQVTAIRLHSFACLETFDPSLSTLLVFNSLAPLIVGLVPRKRMAKQG